MLANLSCSLIENGRIKTTLAKARALRPSIEKAITLAKKANVATDAAQKVHFRRLAIARLRSKQAVKKLFDELVVQFVNRNGGYTRIYKLAMPRLGDAAEMAIIEFVEDAPKKKAKKKKATGKKAVKDSKKTTEAEKTESEVITETTEEASESSPNQNLDIGEDKNVTEVSDKDDSDEPGSSTDAEPKTIPTGASGTETAEDESLEAEPEAKKDSEPESKEDSDSNDDEQTSRD